MANATPTTSVNVADFAVPHLLPLHDPPAPTALPTVAARRPRIAFTAPSPVPCNTPGSAQQQQQQQQWTATTHFYPAAWPRSHAQSARSDAYSPPAVLDEGFRPLPAAVDQAKAEEKRRRAAHFVEWNRQVPQDEELQRRRRTELSRLADPQYHAQRVQQAREQGEKQLWMAVQRIVPVDQAPLYERSASQQQPQQQQQRGQPYTLIVSHANGFHKEVWEPTLASIVTHLAQPTAADASTEPSRPPPPYIDEIWNFDCTHSGEAASLNRAALGEVVSWFDHPRDVLQFLERYLPDQSANSSPLEPGTVNWLPTFLRPTAGSSSSEGGAVPRRKFLLLGHSFGGSALTTLHNARPAAFDGLILIDPAIMPPHHDPSSSALDMHNTPLARGAVARKEAFATLSAVQAYCASKPYFTAWHPSVLDLHLRYGTRPASPPAAVEGALVADDLGASQLPNVPVTWSNSKWHEAHAFAATWMSYHALHALQQDRCRGWTGLVSMKEGFDNKHLQAAVNQLEKGLSIRLRGQHLVVQEEPDHIGEAVASLIVTQTDERKRKEAKMVAAVERPRL